MTRRSCRRNSSRRRPARRSHSLLVELELHAVQFQARSEGAAVGVHAQAAAFVADVGHAHERVDVHVQRRLARLAV
jgi:hypothetical protein